MKQAGSVMDAVMSRDTRRILTFSTSGAFRLWDLPRPAGSEAIIQLRRGFRNAVLCGDAPVAATLDRRGEVSLWRIPEVVDPFDAFLKPLPLTRDVEGLDASPCGRWLATWSGETVAIWSVSSGRKLDELVLGPEPVKRVVFSKNGARVAIWQASAIHIVEVETGKPLSRVNPGEDWIEFTFSPAGDYLLAGHARGRVRNQHRSTVRRPNGATQIPKTVALRQKMEPSLPQEILISG